MSAAGGVPTNIAQFAESMKAQSLRSLFVGDVDRARHLSRTLSLGDSEVLADFSKQRITAEILAALTELARDRGVVQRRDAMVQGEPINNTEHRAVTHMATRANDDLTAPAALRDEARRAHEALKVAVAGLSDAITHVVNIGIGGSDLGPALLCDALSAIHQPHRDVRFVSNIDPLDLDRALSGLSARHTMFVVCSKSFGTSETLANARRAAAWLRQGGVQSSSHMIAVTARPDRVATTGLPIGDILTMPESVGGRYSLSTSVGACVAMAYGIDTLQAVHDGMRLMDEHFVSAPLLDNLPVLMGLVGWWNTQVLGCAGIAVVPYSRALQMLPAYLSQLVMESNGKSVDLAGRPISVSSPLVLGGVGTNAQHAFFQLLHQGTQVVPCDFIGYSAPTARPASVDASVMGDHDVLIANMFAQSQALAFGRTSEEITDAEAHLVAHRVSTGNRPSTTLLFSQLTARALGALVALYEHATFVQGVMWNINSFDQWGVEYGKQLADSIVQDMNGTPTTTHDVSTRQLFTQHLRWRNQR